MKKGIIGALIALCGSAVAIGTAFALYTGTLPAEKTIQIGTKTTGDVQLEASVKNAHSEQVINPDSEERCIEFYAGFTTPSESTYIQDYYYAKLEFKVSSESTDLIAALKDETWVEPGTQTGENSYSTYWKNQFLNKTNVVETDDHKSLTYTMEYPLFKGTNVSEFKFHIRLDTDPKLTKAQFLAIAEEDYSVDFQVSPAESEHAYIVGTACGGWEDREEFRMTVNAKAEGFEWMFKTGTVDGKQRLQDGKEYKLHKGSVYCDSKEENHVWTALGNEGKTFYWNGVQNNDHGPLFN
ncbi:MAG: hypothetical protein SPL75_00145 [Bacilli bacterium]|nr:hypothetical protein [Bacilli bacterium]